MPSSPWQVVKSATKFVRSLLFSSSTRWLGNRIVKWNLDKFEIEKNVTFLIQKKISLKIEKMCTLLPSLLWKNNEWIQLPIETFLNWQFNWVELQFNKFQWVYCSNSSMMCLKAKKKILLPLGIILHNFPLVTSIVSIWLLSFYLQYSKLCSL